MPTSLPTPTPFRMTPADTAWLRMEQPDNPMTISGVMEFGERMPLATLHRFVEERLLPFNRFRMRVDQRGPARWVPDERFALDRHVFEVDLPAPGGKAELEGLVSQLMSTPLPLSKAPWEMHLVGDYEGRSALIIRLHHIIGDGIALMHVVLTAMDEYFSEARLPSARPRGPKPSLPARLAQTARGALGETTSLLTRPSHLVERASQGAQGAKALAHLLLMPRDAPTVFKGQPSVRKRAAWTPAIPLAEVKAVCNTTGAKINDVLLAAASGALRRYLEERGQPTQGVEIRAAVPFNVRPLEKAHELGNAFGLVFLLLPVDEPDAAARLRLLKERMDTIKSSAEPAVVYGILQSIGMAPMWAHKIVVNMFSAKASAVMTNVPGPDQLLHMVGVPIKTLMFWVPQAGDIGLGLSILSYNDNVRVGVATDEAFVPDPHALVEAFVDEFADLKARYGC